MVIVDINEIYDSKLISLLTKLLTWYEPINVIETGDKKKYPNPIPAKNNIELKKTKPLA
jgi:hypothetical protein